MIDRRILLNSIMCYSLHKNIIILEKEVNSLHLLSSIQAELDVQRDIKATKESEMRKL